MPDDDTKRDPRCQICGALCDPQHPYACKRCDDAISANIVSNDTKRADGPRTTADAPGMASAAKKRALEHFAPLIDKRAGDKRALIGTLLLYAQEMFEAHERIAALPQPAPCVTAAWLYDQLSDIYEHDETLPFRGVSEDLAARIAAMPQPAPLADAAAVIAEAPKRVDLYFACPSCGPAVAADEDGCCASCGSSCCAVNRDGVIVWPREDQEPERFEVPSPLADAERAHAVTGYIRNDDQLKAALQPHDLTATATTHEGGVTLHLASASDPSFVAQFTLPASVWAALNPLPQPEPCEHIEWEGDEGSVAKLGRMPVRWKCRACGTIKYDPCDHGRVMAEAIANTEFAATERKLQILREAAVQVANDAPKPAPLADAERAELSMYRALAREVGPALEDDNHALLAHIAVRVDRVYENAAIEPATEAAPPRAD